MPHSLPSGARVGAGARVDAGAEAGCSTITAVGAAVGVGPDREERVAALLKKGVIVRPFGVLPSSLRVTLGTERENDRFLNALAEVLAKSGVEDRRARSILQILLREKRPEVVAELLERRHEAALDLAEALPAVRGDVDAVRRLRLGDQEEDAFLGGDFQGQHLVAVDGLGLAGGDQFGLRAKKGGRSLLGGGGTDWFFATNTGLANDTNDKDASEQLI